MLRYPEIGCAFLCLLSALISAQLVRLVRHMLTAMQASLLLLLLLLWLVVPVFLLLVKLLPVPWKEHQQSLHQKKLQQVVLSC